MRTLSLLTLLLGLLVGYLTVAMGAPGVPLSDEETGAVPAAATVPRSPRRFGVQADRQADLWRFARGEVEPAPVLVTMPAAISGRVFDCDGEPAVRVWVAVRTVEIRQDREVMTDADGRFSVEELWSGRVLLFTSSGNENASARTRLELAPGERGEVALYMKPGDGPVIEGTVSDINGQAMAFVWAGASMQDADPETRFALDKSGTDSTGIHGAYRLEVPGPGRYLITLRARDEHGRELMRVPVVMRDGITSQDVTLPQPGVRCALYDRSGLQVPFSGYTVSWHNEGNFSIGVGGFSSGSYRGFTFPWPGPGHTVDVTLRGQTGDDVEGTVLLTHPGQPCRVAPAK